MLDTKTMTDAEKSELLKHSEKFLKKNSHLDFTKPKLKKEQKSQQTEKGI
jgi:hypothetical protein